MERTRILFTYANTTELGGADYCLLKLASALDPQRFEVHVAFGRSCPLDEHYLKAGVQIHYGPMLRLQATRNPFRLAWYAINLPRTLLWLIRLERNCQIQIIHANDLLDIYGPLTAWMMGIPSVQHIRMILPKGLLKSIFTKIALGLNTSLVTVSDCVAKEMFANALGEPGKIITIYDWLDPEAVGPTTFKGSYRHEINIQPDELLIGSIGRLQRWKGQHIFIFAAAKLLTEFPSTQFVICGGEGLGKKRETYLLELRNSVADLGIEKKIHFAGHRNDVMNIFQSLDIFIHSAISPDPLPGVILEASYCGVPVIAANAGGVPEEVIDDETGFLFNSGDIDALYKKMKKMILMEPEKRRALGEQGRHFVTQKFNKKNLLKQIEALYESLAPYQGKKT